jgi:DHA1 family bicyclomycin/chloramphenicol resistance-like MFS transporter
LIIEYFHISSSSYSIIFGLNAVALIGCAQINARLVGNYQLEKIFFTAQKAHWILSVILLLIALFLPTPLLFIAALMACLGSLGFTFPNATALALAYTKHTGRASALMGTIQFTLAAIASSIVNAIQSHHPMAMTFVILGVSTLSNLLFFFYKSPEELL